MEKVNKQKSVFSHYKKALGKSIWTFLFAGIVYTLSSLAGGVFAPIYYKGIIDSVSDASKYSQIYYFFLMLLTVDVIRFIFSRWYEHLNISSLALATEKIQRYSLNELTKHSYQFFTDTFAGSLVTKAKRFANSFEMMTDLIVLDFLYAIVNVFGILFVLFNTSLPLATLALTWFTLFFYLVIVFTRIRMPLERQLGEMESRTTGVKADIISNVLNLKIFSSKRREEKYFDNVIHNEKSARLKAWNTAFWAYSIVGTVTVLAQSSLIILSIILWKYGEVTAGTIVLIMSYSSILFNRLGGLGSAIRRFSSAYANASEFTEILNSDIEIKDSVKPEAISISKGEITFKDVTFSYKRGGNIFKNLNLTISSGEKVGVIGTSGAGKTTFTKLLLRFADVTSGAILIDGQDIRNITQDDLRNAIGYVPQDPILFHRTLRENIAYGSPNTTEEEIFEAAKKAHAHDFIESLPYGYDTLVGERGIKLSGGERQRVAIARAILKNAPILILDEATSSLDSISEMYIKESLDELMKGKTTIVIAHRLSTIEKMDRIIVMEDGEIVEEGNHAELLSKKGSYFEFWNHQHGGFIE